MFQTKPSDIVPPRLSDYLHIWSDFNPDRTALIYKDKKISFGQWEEQSIKLASWLLNQNVMPGDRIVYQLSACPDFFYLYMAASMIGATLIGVNARYTAAEISEILTDIQPCMVFTMNALSMTMVKACIYSGIKAPIVTAPLSKDVFFRLSSATKKKLVHREMSVKSSDPLLIVYTSGSTGKPKGAILTHDNIIRSALAQTRGFFSPNGCCSDDIFQHQVPVDHVSGSVEWGAAPLIAGCANILNDNFNPSIILANTQKYGATILAGVPTMWHLMFRLPEFDKYDLSSVRFCMSGAAPVSEDIVERMLEITPNCSNPYGMTETSGFCSYSNSQSDLKHICTTVGNIIPEVEFKIVDKKRNLLPLGSTGELAYRGTTVIKQYYNRPDANKTAFDEDGYFYSGDLGHLSSENHLVLMGRKTELFISGGYNVYPVEIENQVLKYPGVQMAAVLPVPHPIMGEVGRCYILMKDDSRPSSLDIQCFLLTVLADYKVPRDYVFLDKFPMTPLGKPAKSELAKEILNESENVVRR
ncbi:acyl--CoA ligase [Acetobacterium wieringae]|uniref:Acyl--CoA ligase n=1 Tax=Acetobacterium wieringae TaxID=52694 RepID=A0ABY6HKK2_9FIRM|nr:class I adenylate-forming enzyme family protein [Acetobacterium wieringae]MEA4807263.1 class I adenylate-forming enzyme family protein [Acetobacterium wieringae]UYO63949.1 acyl--CoA ligase [Acetobacterium wieringae]